VVSVGWGGAPDSSGLSVGAVVAGSVVVEESLCVRVGGGEAGGGVGAGVSARGVAVDVVVAVG
jgi:hypothetical protein